MVERLEKAFTFAAVVLNFIVVAIHFLDKQGKK